MPTSIRCHPRLAYWEKDRIGNPIKAGEYPALVALVSDKTGLPVGIQRIYLNEEGARAAVSNPKKALCSISGGAIHLAKPGEVLHVAEGLETSLAVFQSTNQPVWSSVSAAGMRALNIPTGVKDLHIWADNDPNQAGQKAAVELAHRAIKLGTAVFIHVPPGPIPQGQKNLDWLDILNAKGTEALMAELNNATQWNPTGAPTGDCADASGWDQPVQFRQFDLPTFPTDVLPDWLRKFVEAEAVATQTPTDLAAMLSLSVLGACCAKKAVISVKPGYEEPTNIYTATALPPGNRKSAVFSDMLVPIEDHEKEETERICPEIATIQTRYKILESRLRQKQEAAAKADTLEKRTQFESEAVDLSRELAEMNVPAAPRFIADNVTPERLSTLLRDHGGRMAIMSPEGEVFELMAGRYSPNGAPNFDVFLKGHSGDTLRVDRMGRPPEFVPNPALTIGLTVQPDVIRGLNQKPGFRGRGLLGRFLYSMPESLLGRRNPNAPEVPSSVRALYRQNILALLELPFATDEDGKPTAHRLRLSPTAQTARLRFAAEVEPKLAPLGELGGITDWAGKVVGAVVRIAGLLHMAQHASAPAPWATPISSETMERAIQVGHYLIPHARAAFAEMGADPALNDAVHILSWIKRKELSTVTKREIFEGTKGRFKKVNELENPLRLLIEHGYIREPAPGERQGPGRSPSPTFEVNPYLWADSANIANSANLEDTGLKGNLEDSLLEKEIKPDSIPPPPNIYNPLPGSQYSHNSQNWDAGEGAGEADSGEMEEVIV